MQKERRVLFTANLYRQAGMIEVIEPYHGTIFDPACGSGGMFVHSAEFVPRRHHKIAVEARSALYGVEKMSDTAALKLAA